MNLKGMFRRHGQEPSKRAEIDDLQQINEEMRKRLLLIEAGVVVRQYRPKGRHVPK